MKRLIPSLVITLASIASHAQAKPVLPLFVKANKCDGKLSAVLLSSFKDALASSHGFRLIGDLHDEGKNEKVVFVQMSCIERNDTVAIASAYGIAKCVGPVECHMALDGSSMNPMLCDPKGESQCGMELSKALEVYVTTAKPILKVD
jgi:predicted deacylase